MKGTYFSIGIVLIIFIAIAVGYFFFHVKNPLDVAEDFYAEWTSVGNNFLVNDEYKKLTVLSDAYKQKLGETVGVYTIGTTDPMVCAQDKPDSFTASLVSETATDAEVLVMEKFGTREELVRVDLVADGNSWLINAITCGSGNTVDTQNKVADYVRDFISQLSPTKEVLGGTFFVTKISFNDSNGGVVEYEDGHISLRAEFTYSLDSLGNVHIDSFKILSEGEGKG
ncbi:MAG: hypothetical protein WC757_02285 [Candidatus Paceibacterota bacterium]|jgi:hypothetical protein